MKDLSLEFKSNLQKLFVEKKFSELEIEMKILVKFKIYQIIFFICMQLQNH